MGIDLKFLESSLVGTTVPVPLSGTLSGHAAGEPFDKHVSVLLKKQYGEKVYRQYEYLNELYSKTPSAVSAEERWALISSKALGQLLNRGKEATENWSPENIFEEKQNDTADILIVENGFFSVVDVKTFNLERNGQPPNIISASKLAKMCASMLETNHFTSHNIYYIGVSWEKDGGNLKCVSASVKELFKADPRRLYINWTAATQIQFHVQDLDQGYDKSIENWCRDFLKAFTVSAKKNAEGVLRKHVKPYEKFSK